MNNPWPYRLALPLAVLLALSPYYAASFLLVIGFVSLWNPWKSSFFASYITRFITHFLLFNGVAMLIGMYCWLTKTALHPLLIVGAYSLLYLVAHRRFPNRRTKLWSGYDGWLALGLASVGIVILLACFYLPRPSLAGSIRLITNGYDNSAHMSLIETTYRAKGYVYGPYERIKQQVAYSTLTAYPQGWHATTALWWRGTGANMFGDTNISLRINMYVATILLWQFIAVFLFARASLYVCQLLGLGKKLRQPGIAIGFGAANLLIQLLVFWGTTFYGFATFVAAIAYLVLLAVTILSIHADKQESKPLSYGVALLCTGAITMAWLLPTPLTILMIFLGFGGIVKWRSPREMLQSIRMHRRLAGYCVIATLLVAIAIVAQIGINHLYSVEGGNQINDEGGIFSLNGNLVLPVLAFTTYIILSLRKREQYVTRAYLATTTPLVLGVVLIYAYQMASIGKTVYFFVKVTAFLLAVMGIFFCAAVVRVLSELQLEQKFRQFSIAVLATGTMACLVVFSGQPILNFTALLGRSVIPHTTARTMAQLAGSGQMISKHAFVFTGQASTDLQGTVFTTTMPLHFDACVGDVEWLVTHPSGALPAQIRKCTSQGYHFVFITSPDTHDLIANMHDANVQTAAER